MATEERVVIHVEIDADLAADRAKIEAFFASLQTRARAASKDVDVLEKRVSRVGKTFDKTEKSSNKVTKSFVRLKNAAKGALSVLGKFLSKFSLFSFIGVAIELGLVSIALLGVKLALVSGRLAIKAYQMALTGLGVAAGGVAVVLGSVAAAMRQLNEATLAPDIGGYQRAAQSMRSAMSDQQLSFFGMEGIQTAVTALAKGGVSSDAGYTQILRQLGNYTSDPKQLADLASVYAEIRGSGQISGDSLGKLGGINKTLVSGIEELSGLSGDDLDKALGEGGAGLGSDIFGAVLAGQAEATNAWENQLERMNNTVIGTLKGMLPRMLNLFADLGAPFLDTIQQTLTSIESIITKTVMRIRGSVTGFGLDSFMPGLLEGFELLSDWIARLINESLPKVEGWVSGMTSAWDTIKNYFIDMTRILQPLEAGADVLMKMLGPQFGGVFDGFARLIKNFSKSLVENEATFVSFGDAIGRFAKGFLGFFDNANERFVDAIPLWNDLLDTVTFQVLPALQDIFNMLHTASTTILPVVTKALGAIAGALSAVAQSLTMIMNIPGLGQLLALPVAAMMFKTTRAPMAAAGRATGLLSKPAVAGAGGAAATTGLLRGLMSRQVTLGTSQLGMRGVMAGLPAAMGAGQAAPAAATASLGSLLGLGLASGAGGYIGGTLVGDRIGGTGGIAAGAGLGAGVGAGIGAGIGAFFGGIGAAPGAAIGAGVGAVGGAAGSWFAHRRQDKANEAADELVTEFYDEVSMMLSQGQGRTALEAAESRMTDMLENVAKTAKELGVDETELRKDLLEEEAKLSKMVAERTGDLNNRLDFLSTITGSTVSNLESLADVMGVDLTNGAERALVQLRKLGLITDYDTKIPGIQDASNNVLYESLFGKGSVYEQEYIAPEQQSTLNAYLNEAKDIIDSGGALSADMYRNIIEQVMTIDQTRNQMEGTDLYEGLGYDFGNIDELLGLTGNQGFSASLADIERAKAARVDPTQNKSLVALQAAIFDSVSTSLDFWNASEPEKRIEADRVYKEELGAMTGAADKYGWKDFDEMLATKIEEFGGDEQYDNMVRLGDAALRAAEYLELYKEPTSSGNAGNPNQKPTGFSGRPTPASVTTSSTSSTVNQRLAASTTVNMNVEGLGLKEALALIRDAAQKAARNITQRSSSQLASDVAVIKNVQGGR